MTIRSRLANWLMKDEIARIQARYEAAYWSKSRSYLPGFVQGAIQDTDNLSRIEILRRTRYFAKNNNVLKKALWLLDVNVIGTGITPTPNTGDASWNNAALDWWNGWCETCDVTGQANFSRVQRIAFRAQNVDGDFGIELALNEFERPAVDLHEAHLITAAGLDLKKLEAAGYKVFDGVLTSGRGRPLAYSVVNAFDQRTSTSIPASQFVFYFDQERAKQYRGVSLFHAAVLDLHDLDDLQKYEMAAAKDAASISKIIERGAGAVTVDGDLIGSSLTLASQGQAGQRDAYYKGALAGETIETLPGDKYQQFESKRPSAATSGFWTTLEKKFVKGSGLSYAALDDYQGNWGGAALRAAVQSDNRLYSLRTEEQIRFSQRVWDYAIEWAMNHCELRANPGFRKVRWHPPRRTTVDIGHESDSMLNELKAACQNYEEIFGQMGEDWRERLDQRAQEEAFLDELAKKYNVPVARIASFAQERLAGMAPDATGPEPTTTPKPGAPQK